MATEKKYLDLTGLSLYNERIKAWVSANFNNYEYDDTALANRVSDLELLTNNYSTVASNAANGQTAYTALAAFLGNVTANAAPTLAQIDNVFKTITINGKNLISNGYVNNAVELTGADIAVSATDSTKLSTKISDMNNTISGKADSATTLAGYGIGDAYTKGEVDGKIEGVKVTASTATNGSYVKVNASNDATGRIITLNVNESELSTKIANMDNTISGKADKAESLAGYGIKDAYTKGEVDIAVKLAKDQILGIVDDETLTGAYDTLQEVADWIANDTSGAAAMQNDITNLKNGKADKAESLAGYGIGDAYTKTEVDGKIDGVKVTASTATNGSYVQVNASNDATGRIITLNVNESALSDKITAIENDKTSMSVKSNAVKEGEDGVVFTQKDITVSPITSAEIDALFVEEA